MRKRLSARLTAPLTGLLLLVMVLQGLAQVPKSPGSNEKSMTSADSRPWSERGWHTSALLFQDTSRDSLVCVPTTLLDGILWDNGRLYAKVKADSVLHQVALDSLSRRLSAKITRPADDVPAILSRPVVFVGGFIVGAYLTAQIAKGID